MTIHVKSLAQLTAAALGVTLGTVLRVGAGFVGRLR